MKAETLRALKNARDLAMKNTLAARIPECGDFGHIAQDLDYVLNDIEAYTAPPRVVDDAMVLRACNAYDLVSVSSVEDYSQYPAMHAALKAALEKP